VPNPMTIKCDICDGCFALDSDLVVAAAEVATFTHAHGEHAHFGIALLLGTPTPPTNASSHSDPNWPNTVASPHA
jgi:hypothetical protein